MTDAPERIWHFAASLKELEGRIIMMGDTEYVRADTITELREELREARELLRDAEYDLAQWVECSEFLTHDGYNMDGTPELAARIGAFFVKTSMKGTSE